MREPGNKLLQYTTPVLLVGGGDVHIELVRHYATSGWPVIAADGGADVLLEEGVEPNVIIGDLDSLANPDCWKKTRVIAISEQDTTDFEKCLYSVEAPLLLATGFTGSRFDHTLAAFHVLHKYVNSRCVLLLAGEDVCLARNRDLTIDMNVGSRFSIYPLGSTEFCGSRGLEFPLDGLALASGDMIGTSNRVVDEKVQVSVKHGVYCVIVPIEVLDSLIAQLSLS